MSNTDESDIAGIDIETLMQSLVYTMRRVQLILDAALLTSAQELSRLEGGQLRAIDNTLINSRMDIDWQSGHPDGSITDLISIRRYQLRQINIDFSVIKQNVEDSKSMTSRLCFMPFEAVEDNMQKASIRIVQDGGIRAEFHVADKLLMSFQNDQLIV